MESTTWSLVVPEIDFSRKVGSQFVAGPLSLLVGRKGIESPISALRMFFRSQLADLKKEFISSPLKGSGLSNHRMHRSMSAYP